MNLFLQLLNNDSGIESKQFNLLIQNPIYKLRYLYIGFCILKVSINFFNFSYSGSPSF